MECVVRKDAIVEEVVGFALWRYWEEDWIPPLDGGVPTEGEGEEKDPKLTANGWVLRVTEDDGEVDEDLPGEKFRLTPSEMSGELISFFLSCRFEPLDEDH